MWRAIRSATAWIEASPSNQRGRIAEDEEEPTGESKAFTTHRISHLELSEGWSESREIRPISEFRGARTT